MNNSVQAQKGFKSFLITLSVSIFVFSIIYYLINDTSSTPVDIEQDSKAISQNQPAVQGVQTEQKPLATTQTQQDRSSDSAFEQLSKQKMEAPKKAVLAGATQATSSTQSTVPATGSVEITYALAISSLVIIFASFIYLRGPRSLAMVSYEKGFLKDLEK